MRFYLSLPFHFVGVIFMGIGMAFMAVGAVVSDDEERIAVRDTTGPGWNR